MPEQLPWWIRLGALLPREVRERVYEPACYERLRDRLESGHGDAVGLYAVGAFVGTAGRNLPRIWFDGRALSGLGRVALGAVAVAAGVWLVALARYAYAY